MPETVKETVQETVQETMEWFVVAEQDSYLGPSADAKFRSATFSDKAAAQKRLYEIRACYPEEYYAIERSVGPEAPGPFDQGKVVAEELADDGEVCFFTPAQARSLYHATHWKRAPKYDEHAPEAEDGTSMIAYWRRAHKRSV